MKRSLRNYSFNPNRTFTSAMFSPYGKEYLIPKLFGESNDLDSSRRRQQRREKSDLHNVFTENKFNVVEASHAN